MITPLDWGLGHASRCVPIIRALLDRGAEVVIAAQGPSAELLRGEFPELEVLPMVAYRIRYASSRLRLYASFPAMLARILLAAHREHRMLELLAKAHRIDVVISDSRFGCHTRTARCVYLTHQVCVRFPLGFTWLERLIHAGHLHAIAAYDELWLPDIPGTHNLTGELTGKRAIPVTHRYVGPLSRFAGRPPAGGTDESPDILVMLSGPEPQRTILEAMIARQLDHFPGRAIVLCGTPGAERERRSGNHVFLAHLSGERLHALLLGAKSLVCRAGYTTIMELVSLGRPAVLIPTPGQTEQEFLARRLARQGRFVSREQTGFDLKEALAALSALSSMPPLDSRGLLEEAVDDLLK